MLICKKWMLCILTMFSLFIFVSCNEIEESVPDKQVDIQEEESQQSKVDIEDAVIHESTSSESQKKINDDNEDEDLTYLFDVPVYISSPKNINMEDFLNNPNLGAQENERIKKGIIDILLHVYGFEVDNKNILLAIDEKGREDLAILYYNDDGKPIDNMIDLIHLFREAHVERTDRIRLYSIDANFMLKPYNLIEEDQLRIYVSIYDDLESYGDEGGSRKVYCFEHKKIDDVYKVIGISVDS